MPNLMKGPRTGARPQGQQETAMNVIAAEVLKLVKSGRALGLSGEESVLAVLVGAVSVIRVDGLPEEKLFCEVKKLVPHPDRLLTT